VSPVSCPDQLYPQFLTVNAISADEDVMIKLCQTRKEGCNLLNIL
jgi:hypothetical protein